MEPRSLFLGETLIETIPKPGIQHLSARLNRTRGGSNKSFLRPGFNYLQTMKKRVTPHDYKLALSYNSAVCEVFKFRGETWRYVAYIPSYRTVLSPIFAGRSLYWLTQPCADGKIHLLSFDLLQETFRWIRQVTCDSSCEYIGLRIQDNCLHIETKDGLISPWED